MSSPKKYRDEVASAPVTIEGVDRVIESLKLKTKIESDQRESLLHRLEMIRLCYLELCVLRERAPTKQVHRQIEKFNFDLKKARGSLSQADQTSVIAAVAGWLNEQESTDPRVEECRDWIRRRGARAMLFSAIDEPGTHPTLEAVREALSDWQAASDHVLKMLHWYFSRRDGRPEHKLSPEEFVFKFMSERAPVVNNFKPKETPQVRLITRYLPLVYEQEFVEFRWSNEDADGGGPAVRFIKNVLIEFGVRHPETGKPYEVKQIIELLKWHRRDTRRKRAKPSKPPADTRRRSGG